ncbi:MAG: VapE family protein [Sphingobium sp.]|uniref:VapE domain-containing protein n=1 Tax=Sphingobium sp. TaxID=1912891 RepID=UPI0029B6C2D7|nr:VapE domain-containing protein [Sphingobium sp.]MDX3908753.1 VapE family protein [Sphingobium sp.]
MSIIPNVAGDDNRPLAPAQDYNMAFCYVAALTGRDPSNVNIEVRMIHDTDRARPAIPMRGGLLQLWPVIIGHQAQGFGAFININEMDGQGHKLENVAAIRAHAVDLDNASAQQNYERAAAWTPPPSFAVQTSPGKAHLYWIIQPYIGNEYATSINRRLRQHFDGDKSVIDPSRVLRLPGTLHLKRPDAPHLVTVGALRGFGSLPLVAMLNDALVNVPDLGIAIGVRHELGDPSLAAPSLAHIQRAFDSADPNDLDRGEWIAITAAIKQAGWTHADEASLRAMWDQWCARFEGNDLAENDKQWLSIRETTLGWSSLVRRFPTIVFDGTVHNLPMVPAANAAPVDFWATFNADDANKASAVVCTKHLAEIGWQVAHNEFSDRTMIIGKVPWDSVDTIYPREWTDNDTHGCKAALEATFIKPSKETVFDAVRFIALRNKYHPVRDYLNQIRWDGIMRLPTLASRYFGAAHTAYSELISTKFMISAVARIKEPGCKADTMLILEGAQGAGKSSALRSLVGNDWFTDQMPDLSTKDAEIQLSGKWLIEIAELDRMNRAEVTAVKSYASRQIGTYRPPYGRATINVPRQCIFAGSTNETEYLRDQTGNRRFWPITCGTIDGAAIRRDRDQLWAEAVFRYQVGEHWWLEGDQERLAHTEQDGRRERDPWEEFISSRLAVYGSLPITIEQVCLTILGITFEKHNATINRRVASCLKRAGYTRRQIRFGEERRWRYVKD